MPSRAVGIDTIAPALEYSGIYRKGNETAPLGFTGGSLEALDGIYDLPGDGRRSASLGPDEVIVGKDFAETV
jgi:hypothetical protein